MECFFGKFKKIVFVCKLVFNSKKNFWNVLKLVNSSYFLKGFHNINITRNIKGELSFRDRWTPKLTKGSYNSSNWVEGYEIVTDKYTL